MRYERVAKGETSKNVAPPSPAIEASVIFAEQRKPSETNGRVGVPEIKDGKEEPNFETQDMLPQTGEIRVEEPNTEKKKHTLSEELPTALSKIIPQQPRVIILNRESLGAVPKGYNYGAPQEFPTNQELPSRGLPNT